MFGSQTSKAVHRTVVCMKALVDLLRILVVLVAFWLAYAMVLMLGIAAAIAIGDPQGSHLPRGWEPAWNLLCQAKRLWYAGIALPAFGWLGNHYGPILIDKIRSRLRGTAPSAVLNRRQTLVSKIEPGDDDR